MVCKGHNSLPFFQFLRCASDADDIAWCRPPANSSTTASAGASYTAVPREDAPPAPALHRRNAPRATPVGPQKRDAVFRNGAAPGGSDGSPGTQEWPSSVLAPADGAGAPCVVHSPTSPFCDPSVMKSVRPTISHEVSPMSMSGAALAARYPTRHCGPAEGVTPLIKSPETSAQSEVSPIGRHHRPLFMCPMARSFSTHSSGCQIAAAL